MCGQWNGEPYFPEAIASKQPPFPGVGWLILMDQKIYGYKCILFINLCDYWLR